MAQLLVRNLPDDVKERLRRRAELHGRSLEAEARTIIEMAVHDMDIMEQDEKGFGTLMHERFGKRGLTEWEAGRLERAEFDLRSRSNLRIPDFDAVETPATDER